MTTLILVRHGETEWNRTKRFQGHADPPLNDLGRRQAEELAHRLAEIDVDAIYSSDLRRAFETAEIIAGRKGMEPRPDPALREIDIGSWSGLTWPEIQARYPGAEEHDGETRDEHRARVVAGVRRVAAAHDGGRIMLVSHGGSLRVILDAVGSPRAEGAVLGNCEFAEVTFHGLD